MKLEPGTIIRDYEIISLLGEGGMGEIYLAKQKLIGQMVAIKRLSLHLTHDPKFTERFFNEARIQSQLIHPNIVTFFNLFEHEGVYHMVLQYAPGITLRQLIQQTGPIPEQRTIPIFRQIITALAFAHEKQIIHRDIKPSNIIISEGDGVKVLDFGIARLLSDQHLTHTGGKLGTLFYMSPEQVMAVKDIDHRSDIYSAGVVLFEMLSGRLPFDRTTDSDYVVQHAIVSAEIPDPREIYPHISEATVNLLKSMCVKDRERRCSMQSLVDFFQVGRSPASPKPSRQAMPDPPSINAQASITGHDMVYVEGGSYEMKYLSWFKIKKRDIDVSPFYIGKFPVTQAEWQAVMGDYPSDFEGDNLPVERVSWYDAIAYCNKRTLKEGLTPCYSVSGSTDPDRWGRIPDSRNSTWDGVTCNWTADGYRLPTEAEWEYAASGGNRSQGYKYSGSNDIDQVAWYSRNSRRKTQTVGTKQANELGIHDMSGNVWEWCWDWYYISYYAKSPAGNPTGPASGSCRVIRGGSWGSDANFCRVVDRYGLNPFNSSFRRGLRILRAIR